MRDSYIGAMSEIQALRRGVEGHNSAIAGAVGVRAQLYPHQLLNVWRVLSDLEIRHLIADEVGLGKTVQAIMIINAVRRAHPEAEIAVLVPDALMSQWRDELLTRGHESPRLNDGLGIEDRKVSLLWPAVLERASDLDPKRFGLIVIDEIHNLTAALRDRIARTADEFNGVLLLSATPQLHDPSRWLEILTILEPHMVREARRLAAESVARPPDGPLRMWPEELQAAVLRHLERREAAVASEEGRDLEFEAQRWSLQRRVLRARREDFGELLPRREFRPVTIEPNDAEVRRVAAVESYLKHDLRSPEIDASRLAHRTAIGGPGLLARLGELIRGERDAGGHLSRAQDHSGESSGDTRLDALCDLLNSRWLKDPEERIVVACIDNPTVDYVSKKVLARLDQIGPYGHSRPLTIATARRGEGQAESLSGGGSAAQMAVADLQRGTAQVLFAGDIASVGLNLQCAGTLIFYGLPWSPDEVEQWIGRLDRIGNVQTNTEGEHARTIGVYTLSHRGLLDARVEDALRAFGVFERPIALDGEQVRDAQSAIASAALENDLALVGEICATSQEEMEAPLTAHLPFGPELAMTIFEREQFAPPAEPALIDVSRTDKEGHALRELALEGWLACLDLGEEYYARYKRKRGYGTFWYRFKDGLGRPELMTDVILPSLRDPSTGRSPENSIAYITRRSDIEQPPRLKVQFTAAWSGAQPVDLPFQFMAHGGLLHDDLVRGWHSIPTERSPLYLEVYANSHPTLETLGPGRYYISIGWIDPGTHLLDHVPPPSLNDAPEEAIEADAWNRAADRRWLRDRLGASTLCHCVRVGADGRQVEVEVDKAWSLLKPIYLDSSGVRSLVRCARFQHFKENQLDGFPAFIQATPESLRRQLDERWRDRVQGLAAALDVRATLIRDEGTLIRAELDALKAQATRRAESADERTARIHLALARNIAQQSEGARSLNNSRLDALKTAAARASSPPVRLFRSLCIDFQREVSR